MAEPHAFVAMPFGTKPGADGQPIDFNRVYAELIAPALRDAGLSVFRADQEQRAGDIRTDMFQELLIADLVVADLSIDNPNVWYEVGVRHALRARGVVLISGGRASTAFDLYTDRKLRYGLSGGGPDPATLAEDRQRLTEMVKATMAAWQGRVVSPVYKLLPHLQEPDWKALRIGDVQEFWAAHDAWATRLDLARRAGRIGDMVVLADEAPVAALRALGSARAGAALRKAGHFRFALEHLERALAIEPQDLGSLREKGICLQRLALAGVAGHSLDRARQHYRDVLALHPNDAETLALLGRVDKDAWVATWRQPGRTSAQQRGDAADEDALLRAAIDAYFGACRAHPGHYYSGINALTLMHLAKHLNGDKRYDTTLPTLAGAVHFAADNEDEPGQRFYARATLADLAVLTAEPDVVRAAFREAVACDGSDWFALDSCRAQLRLLQDLEFRPEAVAAGLAVLDKALARLQPPHAARHPPQALLFSGHMVDAPGRSPPRFPAAQEAVAAKAIAQVLDTLGANEQDLALCQGAAGGDLLFLEACHQRGVRCQLLLPFAEPEFVQRSLLPSENGAQWRDRFFTLKAGLDRAPREMPDELGPAPAGRNPYERCNEWLLATALACGIDKVRFIALWNGGGGDGPGGTAHMHAEVQRRTGRVHWIDTRTLW